jgi:hypothetical protein
MESKKNIFLDTNNLSGKFTNSSQPKSFKNRFAHDEGINPDIDKIINALRLAHAEMKNYMDNLDSDQRIVQPPETEQWSRLRQAEQLIEEAMNIINTEEIDEFEEDDGQPTEYDEWQDFMGGDDPIESYGDEF